MMQQRRDGGVRQLELELHLGRAVHSCHDRRLCRRRALGAVGAPHVRLARQRDVVEERC
jgi:hypothetical protein